MLSVAEQFLEQQMHPTVIISAYRQALEDMLDTLKEIRCVYGVRVPSYEASLSPIHRLPVDCCCCSS